MTNIHFYTSLSSFCQQKGISLVAVSKTKPVEDIMELYNIGQRIFGENKVQEMLEKQAAMPDDVDWHLIGHLQRNKVKYIAPFVAMIHSIDSLKLLKEIDKEAAKNDRVIDCLLQFHIAEEDSKFGLDWAEAVDLLSSTAYTDMQHVRLVGVMGMATFTDNLTQVRKEFRQLKTYFDNLKADYFEGADYFKEISMGMSGDYELAVEEGSTMIRVGSLLFGGRS